MGFVMEKVADTLVLCYQLPFHHCTIFMYHSLGSGSMWPIYDLSTKAHSPTLLILLKSEKVKSDGMEHCTVYTANR